MANSYNGYRIARQFVFYYMVYVITNSPRDWTNDEWSDQLHREPLFSNCNNESGGGGGGENGKGDRRGERETQLLHDCKDHPAAPQNNRTTSQAGEGNDGGKDSSLGRHERG